MIVDPFKSAYRLTGDKVKAARVINIMSEFVDEGNKKRNIKDYDF